MYGFVQIFEKNMRICTDMWEKLRICTDGNYRFVAPKTCIHKPIKLIAQLLKRTSLERVWLSQIKATFGMQSLWLYNGIKGLYIINDNLLSLKRTFSPYHTHLSQ